MAGKGKYDPGFTQSVQQAVFGTALVQLSRDMTALRESGKQTVDKLTHSIPVEVINWPGSVPSSSGNPFNGMTAGAGEAEGGLSALGAAGLGAGVAVLGIAAAGAALYAFADKVNDVGFRFAALANPAQTDMYNRAVMNAQAVLGQRFTPVVELATSAVRGIGDFFVEMLPSTQDFRNAVMQLTPGIDALKEAGRDVAPIIKTVLGAGLEIAGAGLKVFATAIQGAVKWVRDFTGIQLGAGPAGNALGAAAGGVTVGSIEDVSRKMFELAVGQGRQDPAVQTVSYLQQLLDWFNRSGLEKVWSRITEIYGAIVDFVKTVGGTTATGFAAGGIGGGTLGFGVGAIPALPHFFGR